VRRRVMRSRRAKCGFGDTEKCSDLLDCAGGATMRERVRPDEDNG
jgi:hypothetical protein